MAEKQFHVLLVEDDPTDARMLIKSFGELGDLVTVEHISDGPEALDRIRSLPDGDSPDKPHLLVFDVYLPEMDGSKLYTNSSFSSRAKNIPIVMFSGAGHLGLESCACSDPHMIYMKKPDSLAGYREACLQMLRHASEYHSAEARATAAA